MQWLLLSVKIQKMISVWWFANKVTHHIDAERNPTGSMVGRIPNNEERSYYKMEVSNYYSTAKLWGTSDKKFSKSSEKNKWKLTDSLKEKNVELAKKDAQDNVYMGNAFMNLRKMEVSKVAPNRAALIGKFNQSMNSGNMSAMKEVERDLVAMLSMFPAQEKPNDWVLPDFTYPKGGFREIFPNANEGQTIFDYLYYGSYEASLRNSLMLKLVRDVVRNRLLSVLREQESLLYSPYMLLYHKGLPRAGYYFDINASVDTKNMGKVDKLCPNRTVLRESSVDLPKRVPGGA